MEHEDTSSVQMWSWNIQGIRLAWQHPAAISLPPDDRITFRGLTHIIQMKNTQSSVFAVITILLKCQSQRKHC